MNLYLFRFISTSLETVIFFLFTLYAVRKTYKDNKNLSKNAKLFNFEFH